MSSVFKDFYFYSIKLQSKFMTVFYLDILARLFLYSLLRKGVLNHYNGGNRFDT